MTMFFTRTTPVTTNGGKWFHGLAAAFIGGGATAVTSWLGLAGAKAIGLDVPSLNLKAIGVIFISGALTNTCSYLKQSPLPPIRNVAEQNENTTPNIPLPPGTFKPGGP